MLSFICSGCGGFGHAAEDSLDSGTQLTCDGCGAKTVVELFSPEGYRRRHELEQQLHQARTSLRKIANDSCTDETTLGKRVHAEAQCALALIAGNAEALVGNRRPVAPLRCPICSSEIVGSGASQDGVYMFCSKGHTS